MKNVRFKKVLALIDSIINKRPDDLPLRELPFRIFQGLQEMKGKGQDYVSPLPFFAGLFKSTARGAAKYSLANNKALAEVCQVRDYAPDFLNFSHATIIFY